MTDHTPTGAWLDHEDRPYFRHRPKLIGPVITMTLDGDHLLWSDGKSTLTLPLADIRQVRLTFRPANLHTRRYCAEITPRAGRKLWMSNVSWRGMVELEAHDGAYTGFLRRLMPAVAKAAPKTLFIAGEPLWRYGLIGLTTLGLVFSVIWLAIPALANRNWGLIGILALLGGYAIWQMSLWLTKNRPGLFDPGQPPKALLPSGVTPPQA
ncbi:hypothetical protein E8L99_21230 [Phreatobacter aquaticus]|uniref:Uncharacterized protein n=1 Tax=Phreatobacter aquaticus TaxID=2570229 RepID=A0A4D7QRI3_9HYPH|nr:hypothetical protein [Phreatobacter aquaticus]QCK88099.1 hypothetical protein E8L99_21230 [Phreatobacter aquaticus]